MVVVSFSSLARFFGERFDESSGLNTILFKRKIFRIQNEFDRQQA